MTKWARKLKDKRKKEKTKQQNKQNPKETHTQNKQKETKEKLKRSRKEVSLPIYNFLYVVYLFLHQSLLSAIHSRYWNYVIC